MAVQPKRIVTPRISTSGPSGFPTRLFIILILIAAWTWGVYLVGRDGFGSGEADSQEPVKPQTEYEAMKAAANTGKPSATSKLQLHIKDIAIIPSDKDGIYKYRITVEPLMGMDGVATGMLKLVISDDDDQVVEIPGAKNELENGRRPFSLSQDLMGDVTLPENFEPEKIALELFTGEDAVQPLIHKYSWSDVLAEKKQKSVEVNKDQKAVSELERENLSLKIKLAKAEAAMPAATAMPTASATSELSDGTVQELKKERDAMKSEIEELKKKVSDLSGKVEIKDIRLKTKLLSREVDFYISIARTIQDGNRLTGAMYVSLRGTDDDKQKVYTHEQITPENKNKYRLGFRNFQEIKETLVVPKGFTPEKIIIQVIPENDNVQEFKKEYDWEKLTSK